MKKSSSKAVQDSIHKNLKYYIIISAVAFAVYANSLSNDFVFDDESVVLGDPSITNLSSIPEYFTAREGFHKVIGRYYRPVVSASYALDYSLWGLKPFGFHLSNVIIHIINCLLFLKLLLLIFIPNPKFSTQNSLRKIHNPQFIILTAAVIFAVHPIHTEAVSWVSGRTDSLSFTFFIAAFIFYLKYSSDGKTLYFFLTSLFFLFALLAKEMAITLPFTIILFDLFANPSLRGSSRKDELKKRTGIYLTLLSISIVYLLIRWAILKDVPQRETYFYFYGKDFLTTAATMLQTLPLYFRLLFVPVGLLYHYNGYLPYQYSFLNFNVIFAVVFIFIVLAAAIYLLKRLPFISFCIFFFFVSLAPVLNIVPTMNFMAERFLYIPSIIISIAVVELVFKFCTQKNKNILYTILFLIIVSYSYLTIKRNSDWKDNDTLFLSAEGRPGTVTYVNIGNIYANKQQIDIAETYYRKAIDIRDETLLANNNLGKVFLMRGNFDSAYYYINKAYRLDTLSPEPIFTLAQLYANNNMLSEAVYQLEKVQKITPNYMSSAQMLEQLKMKLQIEGKTDVVINPEIAQLEQESYKDYQLKNYDKAVSALEELIKLNPDGKSGYYNNIGMCYLEKEKLEKAEKYFLLSVETRPDFSVAYNNLGVVYEKKGDMKKAKESFLKAVQSDPNNNEAKNNLERVK